MQYAPEHDDSAPLSASERTYVHQIVGTLLYYAITLDLFLLVSLCNIASTQASPTDATMSKVTHIMDYVATHPDAAITYRASDMVLASESDASYLSAHNSRSRIGAIHYFTEAPTTVDGIPVAPPPRNGVIRVSCKSCASSSAPPWRQRSGLRTKPHIMRAQ